MATLNRKQKTAVRHERLRKRVGGTPDRPRLSVHFSAKNIYAQVIDDQEGKTIASVNTTEGDFKGDKKARANKETAEKVGRLVAERSKAKNVSKVVFDRGGLQYHGKVKALADAAREGGLEF
jgi:large subunit ribosomal protein L18